MRILCSMRAGIVRHGHGVKLRSVRLLACCYCASPSPPKAGLSEYYEYLVGQRVLQHDEHQKSVVHALHELLQRMVKYEKDMEVYNDTLNDWKTTRSNLRQQLLMEEAEQEARRQLDMKSSGLLWNWFSRAKRRNKVESGAGRMVARINREKKLDNLVGSPPVQPVCPKGIYIYGSVGCGKTMLMDMFYNAAEGIVKHRRRLHFHAAMLEMHDWMHKLWKRQLEKKQQVVNSSNSKFEHLKVVETECTTLECAIKGWLEAEEKYEEDISTKNILDLVAENFLNNVKLGGGGARLLCFDEMQVNDVFTAVALAGVFGRLIKKGAIIVATSNRAPTDLNKDGMQKELFDKFITELQHHCHLILVGSEKDYRRFLAAGINDKSGWPNYFWPLNEQSKAHLERKWQDFVLQAGGKVVFATVPVLFGRTLEVPESCNGAARFSFDKLCDRPVGAADYISLSRNFHTVLITGIPVMSMRNRDKARRFITLVDELYNHRRQLICTAATSIDELFLGSEEGTLIDLESFQFETETENSRLRRNVFLPGSVAPVGASKEGRMSIQSLLSGREELFAFQRAVSRLLEMQTPVYLQSIDLQTILKN